MAPGVLQEKITPFMMPAPLVSNVPGASQVNDSTPRRHARLHFRGPNLEGPGSSVGISDRPDRPVAISGAAGIF